MRKNHHSLHGLLRQSLLRSVICMILPVCVLAGLLVVLTQRYGADIALTTRASEVRTVLVQDLRMRCGTWFPAVFPSRMDGSGC